MNSKIKDEYDVEIAAETLQEAIITTYHNNCPLKTRKIRHQTPWWTRDLETKRQAVHKLFRKALTSGEWDLYRRTLAKYNSDVRKAKRSWRRLCEEVKSTPEGARLYRILKQEPQNIVGMLLGPTGDYTKTGKETMDLLIQHHFPKSTPLDDNENGHIIGPLRRATADDWNMSKEVVTPNKIKWAINSFDPYKSPGLDGIQPMHLQKVDWLLPILTEIFRASLALSFTPNIW
jgi:hypothetical protein